MSRSNNNTTSKVVNILVGVTLGYGLFLLQSFYTDVFRQRSTARPEESGRTSLMQEDGPRKILLDCGANIASTVQLFRETYPGGKDYIIHSFELDERLAPYFASYSNHILHCPVAVATKDGYTTAYAESAWGPDKGLVNTKDMQWGGGAIYASELEKEAERYGRRLGVRSVVPTVDLSAWIQENTAIEDYVILKLDVEGAEYDILKKMLKDGTFKWIDKFYGEFHPHSPVPGWSVREKKEFERVTLEEHKITMLGWAGEKKRYGDMGLLHVPGIPENTPGIAGQVYSDCSQSPGAPDRLALTVKVGMNRKAACKLVETIRAHPSNMPVTLFVYGDFVQDFPDLVTKWADRYTIGIRENAPFPAGHWVLQNADVVRMSLLSAVQRMKEIGLHPAFYTPEGRSTRVQDTAEKVGLRIIRPTTKLPPDIGTLFTEENYYKYRDVERTPKALRILYERVSTGGILSLDSDHPDSYMISAFLMDYLAENSGFELVSIENCLK